MGRRFGKYLTRNYCISKLLFTETKAPEMKIAIVGVGITGLFTACYLRRDSYDVTLIDKDQSPREASTYNGGLLTPSFAPTPTLGLGSLLASALVPRGPLYFSLGQVISHLGWYSTSIRRGLTGLG